MVRWRSRTPVYTAAASDRKDEKNEYDAPEPEAGAKTGRVRVETVCEMSLRMAAIAERSSDAVEAKNALVVLPKNAISASVQHARSCGFIVAGSHTPFGSKVSPAPAVPLAEILLQSTGVGCPEVTFETAKPMTYVLIGDPLGGLARSFTISKDMS